MNIRRAMVLAACALLAGCTGGGDTNPGDATAGDGGQRILSATPSGVAEAWCARAVDLEAQGRREGDTVTVVGRTDEPTEVMPSPCNPQTTGHQLYRYRVRGDAVSLHATTAIPGGTPYLDTVVWVLEGACGEQAPVIACNDDDHRHWDALGGRSTLHTRVLAAGTEVTFVVSAYARARRGATARGEFTLSVTEMPAAQPGQMCDSFRPGACVRGTECVASSEQRGTCATPAQEAEPNDRPDAPEAPRAVTGPLAIHAAIEPAGDVDCFALDVPGGSTLWIEASNGEGSCRADLRADLYRAGEAEPIAGDDDTGRASDVACPRLFPGDNPEVANMAAGTYVLCVRASEPHDQPPQITAPFYAVHVHPVQ